MTAYCRACGHTDCGHPDPIYSGTVVIDDGQTTGSEDGAYARHIRDNQHMTRATLTSGSPPHGPQPGGEVKGLVPGIGEGA